MQLHCGVTKVGDYPAIEMEVCFRYWISTKYGYICMCMCLYNLYLIQYQCKALFASPLTARLIHYKCILSSLLVFCDVSDPVVLHS